MSFKDLFSDASPGYARFRPTYPQALFDWLSAACVESGSGVTQQAWDCATGTGQAAYSLACRFDRVIASDASREQIETALRRRPARFMGRVDFRVFSAEQSGLDDDSIDLISVAQAFHWFEHAAFAREAERVLKPDGLLAVWTYGLASIEPQIDQLVEALYARVLRTYWPPERLLVEQGYASIKLPMAEIATPDFHMTADWDCQQLLGYLATWSAVNRYHKVNGKDPLDLFVTQLQALWGDLDKTRRIHWPLTLRVWKNH